MIILPKQLHTLASVADTKGLDLDSEEFSQICEKSLTWRGKDSQQRTWLQRWKRESWMQHLCSRTLKNSLSKSFVDAWTSSLQDSRANRLAFAQSVRELQTRDICFHLSEMESESANLELFSLKMLKELSPVKQQMENQFSNMSSESWKAWVTEQRQEYSQRLKSAHLTRGSESLSWLTPVVQDSKHSGTNAGPNGRRDLLVNQVNWPTPTARDHKGGYTGGRIRNGKVSMDTLDLAVQAHTEGGLLDQENRNTIGNPQGQQLNPDWVAQLMGLPVGWTDLGSWATE